ncbi:MAG: 50S ribosomal protein L19e [Nanoarchaeota archaeon]
MNLSNQRRMAAAILKASKKDILFDSTRLSEIKDAITKDDLRNLIKLGAIKKLHKGGYSRGRAREIIKQKRKGRRKGPGSLKGSKFARLKRKRRWINKIRAQREFLRSLKEKDIINTQAYHQLYSMSKGGFFRSRSHIKLYMEEHGLLKNEKSKENTAVQEKKGR